MKTLERALKNDLRGMNIREDSDLLGFLLSDPVTGASLFSAYVAPEGFTAYIAYDGFDGTRASDERLLIKNAALGSIIVAIKNEQHRLGLADGPRFANYIGGGMTPSDGVRAKAEGQP